MRVRVFFSRLAGVFRKAGVERDLDDEFTFHLQMEIDENLRRGMSPEDARTTALRRFGGVSQVKERFRETHSLPQLDVFWQDLRYGFRMLRRAPGFSLLVVACLTIGIGATTSVLSWIEGILLRPFPLVHNQDRMVALAGSNGGVRTSVSFPDFQDLRKECRLIDAFIVDRIFGTTLAIGDKAERASGSLVTANYFDKLGIRPLLGRTFQPEEDYGRNAHPVTVISYDTWQERYHGDPHIIGRTQRLNNVIHTIIGVAPRGFSGTFVGYSFNFWVPLSMQETFEPGGYKLDDRGARWIEGYALLKPGVTRSQAQQEISVAAARLEARYPSTNRGRTIRLYGLWETPFNSAGTLLPILRVALAVACAVLLIACANVGNLLLVRSLGRNREMTVRSSIGAGRGRLVRQLLTEGVILSAIAAASAVGLAYWCRDAMVLLYPPVSGIRINLPAEIDWRVLALSASVSLGATLLFGLVPAMRASRIDLASALRTESGSVSGTRSKSYLQSSLVVIQVCLSFVLLTGAGLLIQSLQQMRNIDPGFSTQGVLTTAIDFVGAGYDPQRTRNFQDTLIDRLRSVPVVESAAFARVAPFSYRSYASAPVVTDVYRPAADEQPIIEYNEVGPSYLATMGIPLIAGREFTARDDENSAPVAVVNEPMAAQYWQGRNPVGSRLQAKGRWIQVVGVAKLSKYRTMMEPPRPIFYVPSRQSSPGSALHIRTSLDSATLSKILVREIHSIDANVSPLEVSTVRELIDHSMWAQRAGVTLLSIFGALALGLAAVGLYGVMAFSVSQSTRELGLRMALGAAASDMVGFVMKKGILLTVSGLALGIAFALGLTRLLGNLLFRVSPRDPASFGLALLALGAASGLACLIPAWKAAKSDPLKSLRG